MSTIAGDQNVVDVEPSADPRKSSMAIYIWLILVLLGPLPMLPKLARFLWDREQYQFFPLMIFGACLLAWERWQDLPSPRQVIPGSFSASLVFFSVAMLLLLASGILWIQTLAGAATILLLAGIAWTVGGGRLLRVLGPSLILLCVIIPPPGRWDLTITQNLQQLAVGVSSRMLDQLHVPHVKSGNILEIPGRRLLVEQACSGINSLMAVLAFTLLYGFWKQRPLWRILLLLPAAAVFVVCGNIARITGEAWLKVSCQIDVLDGVKHQLMGLLLFVCCVGLVLSFDELMGVLAFFSGVRLCQRRASPMVAATIDRQIPVRKTRSAWWVAVAFALVGIWLETRVWAAWTPPSVQDHAHFDLPATIGNWQRVNHAAMLVERPQTEAATSFVWQYHLGNLIASVAIDYPFVGYHELTTCYGSSGWDIRTETTSDTSTASYQVVEMSKNPTEFGYLLFNLNDEHLHSVQPEAGFGQSLRDQLNFHRHDALAGATYQVQVVAQQYIPLSAEQRSQTKTLYLKARQALLSQLAKQLER
jgi:exosortase